MSYQPAIRSASVADDGESIALMEPMLLSQASPHRGPLTDLAVELAARAAGLRRGLPRGVSAALADLVRAMNCYYSNLIEGHDTHPVDIERALRHDYSADPRARNLQMEAAAHIAVQRWIDDGGLTGRTATAEGLCELHRRFCAALPEEMLRVDHPDAGTSAAVVPGALRSRRVQVGLHVPVSPGALPRFLQRFEAVYGNLGRADAILGAAAAHHRLLWIHPFLDGNGRVARLMSHAMLLESLETGGVWPVARGLARNEGAYKRHLADCDSPRRHDVDGRGNLSEEALAAFTRFFLEVCLDQVDFLERLVQPDRLRDRVLTWAGSETRAGALPQGAEAVLEAVLFRGELPRGDVPAILGAWLAQTQTRRPSTAYVISQLDIHSRRQIAQAHEEASGAAVHDVSRPDLARRAGLADWPGFDLLSVAPAGDRRAIEVKGRARADDIELSENEWAKACNLRDGYWLYAVYDCATPRPRLVRVRDPFAKLLARSRVFSAYSIPASSVYAAAQEAAGIEG